MLHKTKFQIFPFSCLVWCRLQLLPTLKLVQLTYTNTLPVGCIGAIKLAYLYKFITLGECSKWCKKNEQEEGKTKSYFCENQRYLREINSTKKRACLALFVIEY